MSADRCSMPSSAARKMRVPHPIRPIAVRRLSSDESNDRERTRNREGKMLRRRLMLPFVAVAIALVNSAGLAAAQTNPQRGGTLNIGFPSDSKTLDPTFSVQFTEREVLYLVYNTLVRFGPDFSIQPELATNWTIDGEGKRITFNLRSGVKFQDGTPFNADAV